MRRALLLPLLLAGCTNDRVVEARIEGGALVLDAKPGDDPCFGFLRVTRDRQTVWEIDASGPRGEQRPCAARFPLRWGQLPPGFRAVVPAQAATSGTYALVGSGKTFLRASFRYDGRAATNIPPGTAAWCAAQYPGSKPKWLGGCVIDNANKSQ